MTLTRKDYVYLAKLWVDILSELDEGASTYEIHDYFVAGLERRYSNFNIEKWSEYVAQYANQI